MSSIAIQVLYDISIQEVQEQLELETLSLKTNIELTGNRT
jgi:hypothetical protein